MSSSAYAATLVNSYLARAYLMLDEIEDSAKAGIELLRRAVDAQAPHMISRVEAHLIKLEEAGCTEVDEVQQLHYELNKVKGERDK